jgi:hypothetical protein
MSDEQTEVPQIRKQAKRPVSPEVQALLDEQAALKAKIRTITKAERDHKAQERADEKTLAWVFFRSIARHRAEPEYRKLIIEAGKELAPHDTYDEAKVKSDQETIRRFLEKK